jgi:GntR family transcriptional regulator/MocR family aminotransferase
VATTIPDAVLTPWRVPAVRPATAGLPAPLSARAAATIALRPWPPPGRTARSGLRWNFQYGAPDLAGFPAATWARLVTRRARRLPMSAMAYGATLGYEPLRRQVADYVGRARGVVAAPEQVVIVNGTQQALDLLAKLFLTARDLVVMENPGYQAARQAFQWAGATIVPCAVDAQGLRTDTLPEAPARLAYVTPSHQFPLGGILPPARRLALLRWAERAGALVVEDDYDSEFQYDQQPVQALQGLDRSDRVVYVGTFSKVLFPALRIGYLVVPQSLLEPLAAARLLTDYHTPTFDQMVVADFLAGGHFDRHLRRSRERNRARRACLVAALDEHFGTAVEVAGARAGVHVVAWFRDVRPGALAGVLERALLEGLGIYSVAPYHVRPPARAGLLLGYASLDECDIRDGIRALARVVHRAGRATSR